MLIQIQTDNSTDGDEALFKRAETMVRDAVAHRGERLTRIEVHLSDVNGSQKSGADDKRCVLEARPAGRQPIAVSHLAASVEQSIAGAAAKLNHSLDSVFGRLKSH